MASTTTINPAAYPTPHAQLHPKHVGYCPQCQRAAKQRQALQVAQAVAARQAWQRQAQHHH